MKVLNYVHSRNLFLLGFWQPYYGRRLKDTVTYVFDRI